MATEDPLKAHSRHKAAEQKWKAFLESTPAYVTERIPDLIQDRATRYNTYRAWTSPQISLHCELCDGPRRFDCDHEEMTCDKYETRIIAYTCRDCGRWRKTYALVIHPDVSAASTGVVMKLGEFPPFGSHLAKRLQNLLSPEDLELYRKGLRAEREGQGIGAAAYFRRVVDNQWKGLVRRLRDAAERLGTTGERLKVFDDALAQTQFSAAVDMLKDAIPPKLLILDGRNPLTLLYKPLSVQLHDLSDEQCLQQAADIRVVLNELFDNISRVLKDDEELKGAVNRLQAP